MKADTLMILMPFVALALGLGVLLIGYIGSVRTPVEPKKLDDQGAPTQTRRS